MIFKRKIISVLFVVSLFSCVKVPVTGRRQVNILPESTLMSMSLTGYRDFLSKNPPVPAGNPDAERVKRVGGRIAAAVEGFMRRNKRYAKRIRDYKWEFNLVSNKTVNAWCMPGGKVVVYSGLLPVAGDDTGLAVVMGHEIAHAIARHGNERMSQMMLAEMGGIALSVALSEKSQQTRDIFLNAYGVGATLGVILPYSRTHETEADKLGLIFMALAGYNPSAAIDFWSRMAKAGGPQPPEILSTHPSDETRIKNIRAYLPVAMKHYKPG